jgi:hypothetical protein
MQHDIIDNRERRLVECIKPLLSESERAKFAVGYFCVSGFKAIAAELAGLAELRSLVGNVCDPQTVEQLAETHSATQLLEFAPSANSRPSRSAHRHSIASASPSASASKA